MACHSYSFVYYLLYEKRCLNRQVFFVAVPLYIDEPLYFEKLRSHSITSVFEIEPPPVPYFYRFFFHVVFICLCRVWMVSRRESVAPRQFVVLLPTPRGVPRHAFLPSSHVELEERLKRALMAD